MLPKFIWVKQEDFSPPPLPAVQLIAFQAAKPSKIFNETVVAPFVKWHRFKPTRAHFPGSLWIQFVDFQSENSSGVSAEGWFSNEFLNKALHNYVKEKNESGKQEKWRWKYLTFFKTIIAVIIEWISLWIDFACCSWNCRHYNVVFGAKLSSKHPWKWFVVIKLSLSLM